MKILILSCNTGGGHHAAAYAIAEECARRQIAHEMVDALEAFTPPRIASIVRKTYTGIVKTAPQVFHAAYQAGSLISSSKYKSPVYAVARHMGSNMLRYIEEGGFDVVITTHLFVAQALTSLKKHEKLHDVLTIAVATDYTCIPFWEETRCDYYIAPHADLLPEYEKRGMALANMLPYGIPVSGSFLAHTEKEKARETLGLPKDGALVLIMTGSMGYGHIGQLVDCLLSNKHKVDSLHIAVICGTNEKVRTELASRFGDCPQLTLFGFEKRISLFMDACDVLLSKPGGLTTTEAAVHTVPLIHTNPIPGCETKNARFYAARGMSVIADDPQTQADEAIRLCTDHAAAEAICTAQHMQINPYAAKDIVDFAAAHTR